MDELGIDVAACRRRQQRLLQWMQEESVDLVIVQLTEHVQWLTGPRFAWTFQPYAALWADGRTILVGPERQLPDQVAADDVATYTAQMHSTLRNDQRAAAAEVLRDRLNSLQGARRIGIEFSVASHHLPLEDASLTDVEPALHRLRRRKDPDELAKIRKAIGATEAMYRRAREIIEPGICELEVFNQLQAAAVDACGEMLTGTGNDYQCGSRGGPPRQGRLAQKGELYILDLGPAFRGYFADNARTIAVTQPTDEQLCAWEHVTAIFDMVEREVRPGVSARGLFEAAQTRLAEAPCGIFNHHLGHGIGLFPHEAPHLNPHWDDTFAEGDVFTVEPGLYDPKLQAGMRIENDYRVTADGVECLTPFPLELKL